jgi:hypothetical protein
MHGYDAEQEDDDIIAAFVRRKQKCEEAGVTLEEVFPPAPGSPVVATSQGSQAEPDDSGEADEADSDSTPSNSPAL